MKKFSSVILAAFLFPITLLFVTANANAQITFPLIYGGTYFVQNGYNNWGGGYLDANNTGCEGNLYCVSTAGVKERSTMRTSHWRFL